MSDNQTLAELLAEGQRRLADHSQSARLDAEVLLAHVLGKERSWLLAHSEEQVEASQVAAWKTSLARLESGEPLPYVLGEWEFFGLNLQITPAVLIPRPETELLVEYALLWLAENPTRRQVADVGTGSGAIAVALALNVKDLVVTAIDVSPEALEVAKANITLHGLGNRVVAIRGDLLTNVSSSFDLIAANLPYIPAERLPSLAVFKQEPALALDGGVDGLELIRRLLPQAAQKLAASGMLLAEIDASQEEHVLQLSRQQWPQAKIEVQKDLAGLPRLLVVQT